MANKSLFASLMGRLKGLAASGATAAPVAGVAPRPLPVKPTDTVNEAGGRAYAFGPEHALAQYAATGCLNATFYASEGEQLGKTLELARAVRPEFLAKTAVFARTRGHMKDMPALLAAVLSVRAPELLAKVFGRVIDNGKMLRTFVQVIRSGAAGRRSLGSLPKRLVRGWFAARSDEDVFRASVGNDPSLADVVRMVHPKPATKAREALYGYLIGKPHEPALLPEAVRAFEAYKRGEAVPLPDVPFLMLTGLPLGVKQWAEIARDASWQTVRMNLNTFARHGVFNEWGMAERIAKRLSDPAEIRRARVFPYQLLIAANAVGEGVPEVVSAALADAAEVALDNVPEVPGKVYVCPDISGSMDSPVTGARGSATTKVRCIDVAALIAAAVLRRNRSAEVMPFHDSVVAVTLDPYARVLDNARALTSLTRGGTNCSAPLAELNRRGAAGDLVVLVSDNESWVDGRQGGRGTATMQQWEAFRARNPAARLACIDLQPTGSTQAHERSDILNVGGFSDQVFDLLADFAAGRLGGDHWVGVIEKVEL
jgi:60 kDa SS-A/Ro ribonucleoprotein